MHERHMQEAVKEAEAGVRAGEGGPFGAVVVRDGRVIARGHNQVVARADPTAHAEIQAIRAACRALGTFDLAGCVIYATCEPCPMCFAAIHWSRLDAVHFGATRAVQSLEPSDFSELKFKMTERWSPSVCLPKTRQAYCARTYANRLRT